MKIKAAVSRAAHDLLRLEEVDIEEPRDREVRVRIVGAGVCHTDVAVRAGLLPTPFPVVLGHEGSGIVEVVGKAVRSVAVGNRVIMSFSSCGQCPSCTRDEPAYCHDFLAQNFLAQRADGSTALSVKADPIHSHFFGQSSFATHAICHEKSLVKVGADLPLESLGPLACGIQTGAGAVLNELKVGPGSAFAVVGTGSVGLAAVMAAAAVGAGVIVAADTNESRLELAREFGATHTINCTTTPLTETILGITGAGAACALDTTGVGGVIRQLLLSLAPRGTCGIVGASAPGSEIAVDEVHLMSAGRRLIGIVEGSSRPQQFIPHLLNLHRQGLLPFDRLIRYYDFESINDALRDSESGAVVKPVLRMA